MLEESIKNGCQYMRNIRVSEHITMEKIHIHREIINYICLA